MRPRRVAASVGLSTMLLFTGGCGFILVSAPPSNHQTQAYFTCTESNVGPVLDIVWASLNLLGAMSASEETTVDPGQTRTIGLAWTVVSGSAAAVGFGKTRRCRDAKRMLAERQSQGVPVSPQLGIAPSASAAIGIQAVTIKPGADTIRVGGSVQLLAEARASSGAVAQGVAFTWSSSNDAIASVNGVGLVTAHAAGSVVIAVRTGSLVGTANVTVTSR